MHVDRRGSEPLHAQIVRAIRDQISSGELEPGRRLPSSRDLADQLGVNRATVMQSYAELRDEGWVESGVGRGTFVLARHGDGDAERSRRLLWEGRLRRTPIEFGGAPLAESDLVPLSHAVAHPSLYPTELLRDAFAEAVERQRGELFTYSSAAGYEPLREALKLRLAGRGIDFEQNELLVVNGSQQGLDLIARTVLRSGHAVLTSRPAFSGALSVFRWAGAVPCGVGMDGEGLQPEAFEVALRRHRPALAYLIPSAHNPTGVDLSEERRQRVLALAERYQVPILEDDWLGELDPDAAPPTLKSRDPHGQVLYLGTLSKVLVPGFRIGWLVVPREVFPALLSLKRATDLSCNLPGQAVVERLLRDGSFDEHARSMRDAFQRRRDLVVDAIEEHFPAEVRPLGPHRGMTLWVRLPSGVATGPVVGAARQRGVELIDASAFAPDGRPLSGLRLSYATADEAALPGAIASVGEVLHEHLPRRAQPAGPPLV